MFRRPAHYRSEKSATCRGQLTTKLAVDVEDKISIGDFPDHETTDIQNLQKTYANASQVSDRLLNFLILKNCSRDAATMQDGAANL